MAAPIRPASHPSEEPGDVPRQAPVGKRSTESKSVTPPPASTESDAHVVDVIVAGADIESDLLDALRTLEDAGLLRVRAFVDRRDVNRNPRVGNFPEAHAHASLDDVVIPPGALVLLATSARLHPGHANTAFKRGWHVLCTAPLAPTTREATPMIAAAQRHERTLAVDLRRRFFPAARFLRSLCRDHLLGPVVRFTVHEGTPGSSVPSSGPSGRRAEMPDGVLTELGVPVLDLLSWCLGSASIVSYADDAMGGAEANAMIELAFPDSVRGTVHLSRAWRTSENWEFIFERGIIRWDAKHADRLTIQLASAPASIEGMLFQPLGSDDAKQPAPLGSKTEAAAAQLRHVLGVISGAEPMRVGPAEAMRTLTLIEECLARRTLIEQPWLSHNEAAHARSLSTPAELRRS